MLRVFFVLCALLLVLQSAVWAEPRAPFVLPRVLINIHAMWTDHEEQLFAATPTNVYKLQRSASPVELSAPGWAAGGRTFLTGAGVGAAAVVVTWNEGGRVARFRGALAATTTLPFADGKCLGVVDEKGVFYCAREDGQTAIWDDERWQLQAPPLAGLHVRGATLGPGGALLLIDEEQRIFRLEEGVFRTQPLNALSRGARSARWVGAWYSPTSDTLYVGAGPRRLLAVALKSGQVSEYEIPLSRSEAKSLRLEQLSGARMKSQDARNHQKEEHDAIWIPGGTSLYVFDGRDFSVLADPRVVRFADDVQAMLVDAPTGAAYVATELKLVRLAGSVPPGWGSKNPRPHENWNAPWLFLPLLSLDLGVSWPISEPPRARLGPIAPSGERFFALDVTLGAMYGGRKYGGKVFPWLLPQIGYSFADTGPRRSDLFVAGLGFGYGNRLFLAAYTPRLVAGQSFGLGAVGIRHGLDLRFLSGLLGLELSHQWAHTSDGELQDVRLMFRLNLGMLIVPLVAFAVMANKRH